MEEIVLGIDIGGTTTTFGFVNKAGKILEETEFPTKANEHVTSFLPRLYQEVETLAKKLPEHQLKGIGMGAPNANFYRGTIEHPPNLDWGGVIEIKKIIEEHYKIPVAITNDANAAAIGEMKFGVAQDIKNFILITLGTGLGSGIVVDGDLLYGHTGFAGEMGQMIVKEGGRVCGDGRRGCLEAYVSVTGLRRTVAKMLADSLEASPLRAVSFEDLTGEMISEAASKGDKIALDAFEYTGDILGRAISNAILFTSPEAIIFFGGLAHAKDLILQPTLRALEQSYFKQFKGHTKLLISNLQDKNAAVLGAAALIWHELEK